MYQETIKNITPLLRRLTSKWPILMATLTMAGCTSLKKATLIGTGSLGAGVIASIATSGTAPVLLAAAGGASVTSVVVDAMSPSKGDSMPIAASCAPDNFWTALGDLIAVSGYGIILVILIPMVFSWLLPGPVKFKGKDK